MAVQSVSVIFFFLCFRLPPNSPLSPSTPPFRFSVYLPPADDLTECPALIEESLPRTDRQLIHVAEDQRLGSIPRRQDRKSTRLNSSHANISYADFCLKKKKHNPTPASWSCVQND